MARVGTRCRIRRIYLSKSADLCLKFLCLYRCQPCLCWLSYAATIHRNGINLANLAHLPQRRTHALAGRGGQRAHIRAHRNHYLACMAWSYAFYYICLISFSTLGRAQSISTTTPIPPLQWLNLTSLLSGSAPPPLKDATIAYDETTRTVVIFGGESEGGIVQSQTFL